MATSNGYKYDVVNGTNVIGYDPPKEQQYPAPTQYIYYQQPASTKWIYCKAIHQVLLHLVIIYCVITSTYNTFLYPHNPDCICSSPSTQTTTITEQNNVTTSISIPSTTEIYTTSQPSIVHDDDSNSFTNNLIGDYKISAQNTSHDNWLLCDGSFLDPHDYPQLFDIISYSFGSQIGYSKGIMLHKFGLPNAMDRVIGVYGNNNVIGAVKGNEMISLNESNIPSHWHYLAYGDDGDECKGHPSSSSNETYKYLAEQCPDGSDLLDKKDDKYQLKATNNLPNRLRSSTFGNGQPINIMQPTVFIGNLFIYADSN